MKPMRVVEVIPYKNFKDRIRIVKEEEGRGSQVTLCDGYVLASRTQNVSDGFIEIINNN